MDIRVNVYNHEGLAGEMTASNYNSIEEAVSAVKVLKNDSHDMVLGNSLRATIIPTKEITKIELSVVNSVK